MSVGAWFWVIYVIFVLMGVFDNRSDWKGPNARGSLVLWILIFLLGVGTFGWPLKG